MLPLALEPVAYDLIYSVLGFAAGFGYAGLILNGRRRERRGHRE